MHGEVQVYTLSVYLARSTFIPHDQSMRKRNRGSAPGMTSLLHVALSKAGEYHKLAAWFVMFGLSTSVTDLPGSTSRPKA
jgi:hypothetical protein